jgi:hypothetical protein
MSPIFSTMPKDWVTTILAAQGCALQCIDEKQSKVLLENVPDTLTILAKAVLYQAYLLNKSNVTEINDFVKLAEHDSLISSTSKIVNLTLSATNEAIEMAYSKIKEEKLLMSDFFPDLKTTTH